MSDEDIDDPWIPINDAKPFQGSHTSVPPSDDIGRLEENVISIGEALSVNVNCGDGSCYKGFDPKVG